MDVSCDGRFLSHYTQDNVVKKPKTAIVIPRSLRRGISNIRYDDIFRFTKRSLAALGMTIRIFYEGIILFTMDVAIEDFPPGVLLRNCSPHG
jgi:hypothetical protein